MPEAVHAVSYLRLYAELFPEILFAVEALSHAPFSGGQVHVGLNEPAVDHDPPLFPDQLFEPLEFTGVSPFEPPVNPGLAPGEYETFVFFKKFKSGETGFCGLNGPLGPSPEPCRIEMGVAYHVDFHVSPF